MKCRIVVLNYNGKDLLEKFLPSVIDSAKASRHECRVSVLDNCSIDDSVSFLKSRFPDVNVRVARENKVLCSYNELARQLDDDVIILLNSDIQTDRDFVDPLVSVFSEKKDAFFVATYGDRAIARMRWGILTPEVSYEGSEQAVEERGFTFSAGIGAFDRKKFIDLGGYDELYLPGIGEDVDLCYRGWKRGWVGYYQPDSKKLHLGRVSFSRRYSTSEIERMAFRNGILFMIKNITDPRLLTEFALMLFVRLLRALLLGKWFMLMGFVEAIQRMPEAIRARREVKKHFILSDREVIKTINSSTLKGEVRAEVRKKKAAFSTRENRF